MRIFCIGRNYAAHAAELKNDMLDEPVVFINPSSCLVTEGQMIRIPNHGKNLHHEAEIVIRMDSSGGISGLGIGLDLTLRDVQSALKNKGLPWEKAKAFDGSAPLGKMVDYKCQNLTNLLIGCRVNGQEKQRGNSGQMLFSINDIIAHLQTIWKLQEGDLIFTGTPQGVGDLKKGDKIEVFSDFCEPSLWTVA